MPPSRVALCFLVLVLVEAALASAQDVPGSCQAVPGLKEDALSLLQTEVTVTRGKRKHKAIPIAIPPVGPPTTRDTRLEKAYAGVDSKLRKLDELAGVESKLDEQLDDLEAIPVPLTSAQGGRRRDAVMSSEEMPRDAEIMDDSPPAEEAPREKQAEHLMALPQDAIVSVATASEETPRDQVMQLVGGFGLRNVAEAFGFPGAGTAAALSAAIEERYGSKIGATMHDIRAALARRSQEAASGGEAPAADVAFDSEQPSNASGTPPLEGEDEDSPPALPASGPPDLSAAAPEETWAPMPGEWTAPATALSAARSQTLGVPGAPGKTAVPAPPPPPRRKRRRRAAAQRRYKVQRKNKELPPLPLLPLPAPQVPLTRDALVALDAAAAPVAEAMPEPSPQQAAQDAWKWSVK